MTSADYREALRLLESAIELIAARRMRQHQLRRRLARLSLEADLLRARLGQAPARLQRN